jgi:hypothetical protein
MSFSLINEPDDWFACMMAGGARFIDNVFIFNFIA